MFAQSKGAESIMVGIGGSNMGTGNESEEIRRCLVCVDIVAVEDGGIRGMFVWTEAVAVVGVEVTRWLVWTPVEMKEVVTVSV